MANYSKLHRMALLLGSFFIINHGYGVTSNMPDSANPSKVAFLYAQTAKTGTLQKNDDGKTYTIVLQNVEPETIQFSDRPFRFLNTLATSDFIARWTVGKNNFKADHPNAALGYTDNNQALRKTYIVELFCPIYQEKIQQVSYQAIPIGNTVLPDHADMIKPSIFID